MIILLNKEEVAEIKRMHKAKVRKEVAILKLWQNVKSVDVREADEISLAQFPQVDFNKVTEIATKELKKKGIV